MRAELSHLTEELKNITTRISEGTTLQRIDHQTAAKNDSSATIIPENDEISNIEPVTQPPVSKIVRTESTAIDEVDSDREEIPNFVKKDDEIIIDSSEPDKIHKRKGYQDKVEIGSSDSEDDLIRDPLNRTNEEVSLQKYYAIFFLIIFDGR